MRKIFRSLLILLIMTLFTNACYAVTEADAVAAKIAALETSFKESYEPRGYEKDPAAAVNPKYTPTGDGKSGICELFLRQETAGTDIKEETFIYDHIKGEEVTRADGSGNVIHPSKDNPNYPNGCPNCKDAKGNPIFHQTNRDPECQCGNIEETAKMEAFKTKKGYSVVSEVYDDYLVDWTCGNQDAYGKDAYESKVQCKVYTVTITLEENDAFIPLTVTVNVSFDEAEPPTVVPPAADTIEVTIIKASKEPYTFNLNTQTEIDANGYSYMWGFFPSRVVELYPGTYMKNSLVTMFKQPDNSDMVITVEYNLYVVDFDIIQNWDDVTDNSGNNEPITLNFVNGVTPPTGFTYRRDDGWTANSGGEALYLGKNIFWLIIGGDETNKVSHFVTVDTKNADGTLNADFDIQYIGNGDENVTDKEFVAITPSVEVKLVADENYEAYNNNKIKWDMNGVQIGQGVSCTVPRNLTIGQEANFSMKITTQAGQSLDGISIEEELTPIGHKTTPKSPVPWETATGSLKEDESLRIVSVRDLRWQAVQNAGKKFYVTNSGVGDKVGEILKPSSVAGMITLPIEPGKYNPLTGYGVEFNMNTSTDTIQKPSRITVTVTSTVVPNPESFTIEKGETGINKSFLEKCDGSKWSWLYYIALNKIADISSLSDEVPVGIKVEVIYDAYSQAGITYKARKVDYSKWVYKNGTNVNWTGGAFTYNGRYTILDDIDSSQVY